MKKIFCILLFLCFYVPATAQPNQQPRAGRVSRQMDTVMTPEIGGIQQVLEIKTDDGKKPVLLFLSGGPGSSLMPAASGFTGQLKDHFTLVQWDQRGAGKTLALHPSLPPPSLAQLQQDTYDVVRFLVKELNQKKLYVLGSSWGNVLGFYLVEHHPDLLQAYFAVNPVVSQLASEQELLALLKSNFKSDSLARTELARVQIPFQKKEDLFYLRKWLFYQEGKQFATSEEFKKGFLAWSETWSPVWNEVMKIDLPKTLKTVKCPVYFFVGKHDIQTSTIITQAYYQALNAPRKSLFLFENSGHQIHKDEPETLQKAIIQTVETTK